MKKHNPYRYGEIFDSNFIADQLTVLESIKQWITLSGGWAWHFISPPHIEYKHIHDHKDIDIFVSPVDFTDVQLTLESIGFKRMKTKYDNNHFIRYERIDDRKIVIDMFKKEIPFLEVKGWKVANPEYLLSLYDTVHQSDHCIAVKEAKKLLDKGIEKFVLCILNYEELIKLPTI